MKEKSFCTKRKIFELCLLGHASIQTIIILFTVLEKQNINVGLKIIICLLSAAVIVTEIVLYYRMHKTETYYRDLCERFAEGKIYQEYVENIGKLFSGMMPAVKRMDSLLERQNVIRLSTKQAEFLALQNQINPHFLYNTLEAIRGDALCAGMENIADITEALSTFFRYTITETRNLVTIQEELENVDNYFKIQQYRFGEKLSMDIQICDDEEKIMQMQCPKLSLQPIIENSIFHGLEKKREKGLVSLMIEMVDENLHISISDNGVGIKEERLAEINDRLNRVSVGYIVEDEESKKGGIALKNVCRRIKLLFGEQYGIHVDSIVGIGTKVVLVLPVIYKKDRT